jgi:hypothetical protein
MPVVTVDQELIPGDYIFNSVQFTDFNPTNDPVYPEWAYLFIVPKEYLNAREDVYMYGSNLPVEYTLTPENGLMLRFEVFSEDSDAITKFWLQFDKAANLANPSLLNRIADMYNIPIPANWYGNTHLLPSNIAVTELIALSWLQHGFSMSRVNTQNFTRNTRKILDAGTKHVTPPWVGHLHMYDNEYDLTPRTTDYCND